MPISDLFKKLRQVKMITNNMDKKDEYSLQGIPKKIRTLVEQLGIIL